MTFETTDAALEHIMLVAQAALELDEIPPFPCGGSVTLLPVPYVSQLGDGADARNNDCGPACGVMLAKAYTDIEITVNGFGDLVGVPGDVYLSATQIQSVLSTLGVPTFWERNMSIPRLFEVLSQKKPPIVLIDYGILNDFITTESRFEGPHFAVVTGIDLKSVFIHDPLWTEGGEHLEVPLDAFDRAWYSSGPENPGLHYAAIVPKNGLGQEETGQRWQVTWPQGLNVRSEPAVLDGNKVGSKKMGDIVTISEIYSGTYYDWGRIDENEWMAVQYRPTEENYAVPI